MEMNDFNAWFLSCNLGHKLNIMRDALVEGRPGIFMSLLDIVLEAPISQGGIPTETLQKAFGADLTNPNKFTNGKRFKLGETFAADVPA